MGTNNAINANETTPLSSVNGGSGLSSPTANALLYGNGSSAFGLIGPLTNGQIPIGSTGNPPVPSTIGGGTGVSVTTGPGTLSINVVTGGLSWTNVTGATQTLSPTNGYLANRSGGNVSFSLPGASVVGDLIKIIGIQNGFSVSQAAGQQIIFGNKSSTLGTGGSITSTHARDCVTMTCVVANTTWQVEAAVGNITIV